MMEQPKRFEDWVHVDCNECTHYWDSSCDGASKGSRIGCNSYLATRSIILPSRLKKLESRVKWLELAIILLTISLGCLWLVGWL